MLTHFLTDPGSISRADSSSQPLCLWHCVHILYCLWQGRGLLGLLVILSTCGRVWVPDVALYTFVSDHLCVFVVQYPVNVPVQISFITLIINDYEMRRCVT